MRRIVHLDMDAFYASVEQRDQPELRGKPVAVGGRPDSRGVVAAASYEARAFGVRSAMPMARAVRLCPQLVIVHPDFERYRRVSSQVMEILRACTPLVEPLSLDEAYLDVTENAWNEPLGMEVARRLKQQIVAETQLTASAGVAPNKFLAKIASGYRKPDGLTVIAPERVEAFLQDLPVEALWGVGPVTARKLRAVGIEKLVQIRTADMELLHRTVGSLADWLRQLSFGDDPRPVTPDRESKSSSTENTYAEDLTDLEVIRAARERRLARAPAACRAHSDDQGPLRRFQHDYAQPHVVGGHRGRRRDLILGHRSRCAHRCRPHAGAAARRARGRTSRTDLGLARPAQSVAANRSLPG